MSGFNAGCIRRTCGQCVAEGFTVALDPDRVLCPVGGHIWMPGQACVYFVADLRAERARTVRRAEALEKLIRAVGGTEAG